MEEGDLLHKEPTGVYEEQKSLEAEHGSGGVELKAKAFVARHKEEVSGKIRAVFADQVQTYAAIGSYNRRLLLAPNLYGGAERQVGGCGDFFTVADGRMGCNSLHTNFGTKSNISLSLDPDELKCMVCNDGHVVLERRGRASRMSGERQVFLLGDQALPANLPRGQDSGCCVGVIRREYADKLIETFLSIVRYRLAVLLSSPRPHSWPLKGFQPMHRP